MKTTSLLLLSCITAAFVSCGGKQSTEQNSTESSSNTSSANSNKINTAETSNSKGVGKFSKVSLGKPDEKLAEKGETLFNSKCTMCHQRSSDNAIGPGLKDVTKRRTPEWILNMITNPDEMVQKDAVATALYKEYTTQMPNQNISEDEARQLLEFLRINDR